MPLEQYQTGNRSWTDTYIHAVQVSRDDADALDSIGRHAWVQSGKSRETVSSPMAEG